MVVIVFSTRHDGEARLNEEISELRKELAERNETVTKLQKRISTFEDEVKYCKAITSHDFLQKRKVIYFLFSHLNQIQGKSVHEARVDSLKKDAKSYEKHSGECSGSQTGKDVVIRQLRDDLELSEKQRKELLSSLEESENFIARLQGEMGRLENDNYISTADANSKTLAIKTWESNFREGKLEV